MDVLARQFFLDNPDHVRLAAEAMREGAVVAHGFGNFYALSTRPDRETVRHVNLMKGRPADQVGSVLTVRDRVDAMFDWDAVPRIIDRRRLRDLVDDLLGRGPIGFRGPAAACLPEHLTSMDGPIRTAQLITPGYRCPSGDLLQQAIDRIGAPFLYVTSANRSRHVTGAEDEPAHFEADGLAAEFGGEPGFLILRHPDEAAARAAYPQHLPMSTTVVAFHRLGAPGPVERPVLTVERHGSLAVDALAPIAAAHGFELTPGAKAQRRLTMRAPIARFEPLRCAR